MPYAAHHDRRARPPPIVLSLSEIARGVGGALRLMRNDAGGLHGLDRSAEGFRRSFGAAVLLAPLYVLHRMTSYAEYQTVAPLELIVVVEALFYVIGWTMFPVALLEVARRIDRSRHYFGAVVAVNWATVPIFTLYVFVGSATRLAGTTALDAAIGVTLALLAGTWLARILRHALDTTWLVAIALAVMEFFLSATASLILFGTLGLRPATA